MPNRPLQTLIAHLRRSLGPRADSTLTDAQLLHRWVSQRDQAAFELLLWRHGPMVLAACQRLLRDAGDVEDAFQAVWLVLLHKASSIRTRESLPAWLHRVACRVALRARSVAAKRAGRESPAVEVAAPEVDPVAQKELRAILDEEVDRLPALHRQAFILCYLEGKTQEEAAGLLGCPRGTVSSWLTRARDRLRDRLSRRGLALSAELTGLILAEGVAPAGVLPALVMSAMKAVLLVTAGQAMPAGVVSARATVLMEGVLQAMIRAKLQVVTLMLLALGLLGTATGLLAFRTTPQEAGFPSQPAPDAATLQAPERDVYALVLVEAREPQFLPGVGKEAPGGGEDPVAYRRNQPVLLKSRWILQKALHRPKVEGLAVFKGKADPLGWLERNLRADYVADTAILRISVIGGSPEDRATLTNAVVQAYFDEVVYREKEEKVRRVQEMMSVLAEHEMALKAKRQALRTLALELRGPSHPLKQEFDQEDLAELRKDVQRAHLTKLRAQARLNYLTRAKSKEGTKGEVTKLEEEVAVLAEQENLLKAEIAPLAEAAQTRIRAEAAARVEEGPLREEAAAEEQIARRIAAEVMAAKLELRAGDRVRVLQSAEANPRRK